MSNDLYFGFTQLPSGGPANPHVFLNEALEKIGGGVAGQLTIDFASDANLALAIDDENPEDDQWTSRNLVLTDTGVVLTAARDVIYPDVDGEYTGPSRQEFWVDNQTAQTLTVKRSGQPGVSVPAGARVLVRHNGTDIELAAPRKRILPFGDNGGDLTLTANHRDSIIVLQDAWDDTTPDQIVIPAEGSEDLGLGYEVDIVNQSGATATIDAAAVTLIGTNSIPDDETRRLIKFGTDLWVIR